VSQRRRAFTLMELILVLAILVVITSLAYPSLETMYGDLRVNAAADSVRGAWATARAQAMDGGRAYRFEMLTDTGEYRVVPVVQGEPQPVVLDVLPKGVRASLLAAAGNTGEVSAERIVVTFLPDGSADQSVELLLQLRSARSQVLKLRGLTGVVSVRPL
jgi:prepilin-type N-terminal cleavage/methylation domain-containing protein